MLIVTDSLQDDSELGDGGRGEGGGGGWRRTGREAEMVRHGAKDE